MKLRIFLILFVPTLLLYSCVSTKDTNNSKSFNDLTKKYVIVDKNFDMMTLKKDYVINEASLKDSVVSIKIKYTGCTDDDWDMVFNGNYLKTFPPKASLVLVKKSGIQNCEKKMEKELNFILSPVKDPSTKTLVIQFPNYEPKLLYNY
jgi:hypothetical protein